MTDPKLNRSLGIFLGILIAIMGIVSGISLIKAIVARSVFQPIPSPVSVAPTYTPRSIGETEFVVNGVMVEDVTQPHYVTDPHQISIEIRVRDADGETISDDEVLCLWTFHPPLQEQATGEEGGGCRIGYRTSEDLDSQLVTVVVQGQNNTQITGKAAKSVLFPNILNSATNSRACAFWPLERKKGRNCTVP